MNSNCYTHVFPKPLSIVISKPKPDVFIWIWICPETGQVKTIIHSGKIM